MAYISSAPKFLASSLLTVAVMVAGAVSPVAADTSYVVQPGDTLSVIAKKNGVSTADLAAANAISNYHLIRVGQTLAVPSPTPSTYTVVGGDTVSGIARVFGVPSKDIIALNGISDPSRIKVGQQLQIPGGRTPRPVTDRYRVLPSRIVANPQRLALVPSFEHWAQHYGVPTDLLMAICYQESGWQSAIVSSKGAVGVGQLLPPTAQWVARDLIGRPELDIYDPDNNIRVSARFLRWLIGFHGGEPLAIAGYYQGPTSVTTKGLFPQTEAYVASVQGGRWRFQSS